MAKSKNIVVCPYHHFYDGDKYSECPECAKGKGPNADYQKSQIKIEPAVSDDKQHTKKMSKEEEKNHKKELAKLTDDNNPTQYIWNKFKMKKIQDNARKEEIKDEAERQVSESDEEKEGAVDTKPLPVIPDADKHSQAEWQVEKDTQILRELIDSADVDQDDVKTISVYGSLAKVPVGWLVAIEGNDLGSDYRIVDGKNLIGRDPNMNISIKKDKSVSRDRHTVILYDAEGHDFYLLPNEGKGTVHLNQEIALAPVKLHKGDQIKIGNTVLYFLPLCDENFDWNDYI